MKDARIRGSRISDDGLLTEPQRKEALSRAYVHAIAFRAGYDTSKYKLDQDGVDLRIQASGFMRPALELQLKATTLLKPPVGGLFRFPLKIRNYKLLRIETQTPRLLVVLNLPTDEDNWVTITEDELVLRRAAYWVNLRGFEEVSNQATVTVSIPKKNLFDIEGLQKLMEQSRRGIIE